VALGRRLESVARPPRVTLGYALSVEQLSLIYGISCCWSGWSCWSADGLDGRFVDICRQLLS